MCCRAFQRWVRYESRLGGDVKTEEVVRLRHTGCDLRKEMK